MSYLWVALGGALGSVLRYWLSNLIGEPPPPSGFPLSTLLINVTGSFVIGIFAVLAGPLGRFHPDWRNFSIQLVMIGICGGYTTFSSFSLQTLYLAQEGRWDLAALNIGLSVVFCLVAVWLGYATGSLLNR